MSWKLPQPGLAFRVFDTYETMSYAAAALILETVQSAPRSLLCLATGSTPRKTYEILARQPLRDVFRDTTVLKLDEWAGLTRHDPGSCEQFLRETFIDPLKIAPNRFNGFQSDASNRPSECRRIEAWLGENGPIDFCVLGLGLNGHIGFNEPGSSLEPFAHCALLSEASRGHPMLQRSQTKPTHGYTLGVKEILGARRILLLVNGHQKAKQLAHLATARISTEFPASFLWLHANVLCCCDKEAAAALSQNKERIYAS